MLMSLENHSKEIGYILIRKSIKIKTLKFVYKLNIPIHHNKNKNFSTELTH